MENIFKLGIVFMGLIFAIAILFFWQIGIFSLDIQTESGMKLIAAAIGLIGTVLTLSITFVGYMFKRSYDCHDIRLRKEAESRLKMETVINAVKLLGTESGEDAGESQQYGALFALARLNQLGFAITLLQQMWPQNKIAPSGAVFLINDGLQSKDNW